MSQTQENIYFLRFQSLIMRCNGKQSSEGSPHPEVETGHCTGYGLETRGWLRLAAVLGRLRSGHWLAGGKSQLLALQQALARGGWQSVTWSCHDTLYIIRYPDTTFCSQKRDDIQKFVYLNSMMSVILRHGAQQCLIF